MPARRQPKHLETGDRAPRFPALDQLLAQGPVLLVLFKTTCPVCDMTLPFLERFPAQVLAVSQDEERETREFTAALGLTFRIAYDGPDDYAIGEAYGISSVPAFFLIDMEGTIQAAWEGFSRANLAALGLTFQPADNVPEWKAGCSSKNV